MRSLVVVCANGQEDEKKGQYLLDTWARCVHRSNTGSRVDNARPPNGNGKLSKTANAPYLTRRCRAVGRQLADCTLTQRTAVVRLREADIGRTENVASKRRTSVAAFTRLAAEQILQVARRAVLVALVHRRARLTFALQTAVGIRAVAETAVERAFERRRTYGHRC